MIFYGKRKCRVNVVTVCACGNVRCVCFCGGDLFFLSFLKLLGEEIFGIKILEGI